VLLFLQFFMPYLMNIIKPLFLNGLEVPVMLRLIRWA